jgi:hypothetical protein
MMIDSSVVRPMTPGLEVVLKRKLGMTRALTQLARRTVRVDEACILRDVEYLFDGLDVGRVNRLICMEVWIALKFLATMQKRPRFLKAVIRPVRLNIH